jgi:hypothetical protein
MGSTRLGTGMAYNIYGLTLDVQSERPSLEIVRLQDLDT